MLSIRKTKVVLPTQVLEKEGQLNFKDVVQVYLKRYKGYQLLEVVNGCAVCEVKEWRETSDYKNKKSRHKRGTSGAHRGL